MNEKTEKFLSVLEEVYNAGGPSPDNREYSQQPSVVKLVQEKLKISSRTYYRRVDELLREGYVLPWDRKSEFTGPLLDTPDMSEEELVDHVTQRFEKRRKATNQ